VEKITVDNGETKNAEKRRKRREKEQQTKDNKKVKWNGPANTEHVTDAEDDAADDMDDLEEIDMGDYVAKPLPPKRDPFARNFIKESKDAELFVNLARQTKADMAPKPTNNFMDDVET